MFGRFRLAFGFILVISATVFAADRAAAQSTPRIDRVSMVATLFRPALSSGQTVVDTWLYIQVANGTPSARISIDGRRVFAFPHRAVNVDLLGVPTSDLAFPITLYRTYAALVIGKDPGSTLSVAVSQGGASASTQYVLPLNAATMDSDGDDIPDRWEQRGYDANSDGTIDVDLPALGANRLRPDVLVEVDVMQALDNPPDAAVWAGVRDTFAQAPVVSPLGQDGINIILDTSGQVPFSDTIELTGTPDPTISHTTLCTLKATNFDNALRGRLYHYAIWGNMRTNGSSGVSDVNFSTVPAQGDDFLVTFDDFPQSYQTVRSKVETFVHEIGHNLGLRHGGETHFTRNPSHNSVMSYNWQLRTGTSDFGRRNNPVYSPFYYLLSGYTEPNGQVANPLSPLTSYSMGMGRLLNEAQLNEPVGLFSSVAIDWNKDGDSNDVAATADLNNNGNQTDTFGDHPNWALMTFVGPRRNGRACP